MPRCLRGLEEVVPTIATGSCQVFVDVEGNRGKRKWGVHEVRESEGETPRGRRRHERARDIHIYRGSGVKSLMEEKQEGPEGKQTRKLPTDLSLSHSILLLSLSPLSCNGCPVDGASTTEKQAAKSSFVYIVKWIYARVASEKTDRRKCFLKILCYIGRRGLLIERDSALSRDTNS